MSSKLNRDAILREMLGTLVRGWGKNTVYQALNEITEDEGATPSLKTQAADVAGREPKAVDLVQDMPMASNRKILILQFARAFDAGVAFPRISDVKMFLASHHQSTRELRSRTQGFYKMIPILEKMSEKGLIKLMSRSKEFGLAELDSISDAIKNSGKVTRGLKS
jgi:hypothetical protein